MGICYSIHHQICFSSKWYFSGPSSITKYWPTTFCCNKHTKLCILYVERLEAEVINVWPWHWTIEHSQWLQSQTTTMINWRCSLFSENYLHKMLNNLLLDFLEFNFFCITPTTIKVDQMVEFTLFHIQSRYLFSKQIYSKKVSLSWPCIYFLGLGCGILLFIICVGTILMVFINYLKYNSQVKTAEASSEPG